MSSRKNCGHFLIVIFIYFTVSNSWKSRKHILLTLHGIDTLANITLNDQILGTTDNMFVRYRYNIAEYLNDENNILKIEIKSPIIGALEIARDYGKFTPPECPNIRYNGECHMNLLRKMQSSFSWDWGLAAPSMGIWKNIVVELYDSVFIRDVTYEIRSVNDDGPKFKIMVDIHFEVGDKINKFDGTLTVEIM